MTFIDLEGNNGSIVAEQIVRLRPYSGGTIYSTVITLTNNQEIFTEKTIAEIKELANGKS